jgi:MFS superfamily sulfate permease-like transporter
VAHGLFLLVFLVFLKDIIHQIPLAALAAMLVFTGYRLAGPSHWRNAWAIGKEQFAVFAFTVFVTLATDLLVGIFAGVLVNLIWNLANGGTLKGTFKPAIVLEEEGESIMVQLRGSATFSNWIGLRNALEKIPATRNIIVDLSQLKLADHALLNNLESFKQDRMRLGATCDIRMGNLKSVSDHPMASKVASTI